jgi:hypothetical protein
MLRKKLFIKEKNRTYCGLEEANLCILLSTVVSCHRIHIFQFAHPLANGGGYTFVVVLSDELVWPDHRLKLLRRPLEDGRCSRSSCNLVPPLLQPF